MARMGYPFDGFLFFSPIVLGFRLHTLLAEQRQLCLERHIWHFWRWEDSLTTFFRIDADFRTNRAGRDRIERIERIRIDGSID
jgi:hypothetical protein